MNQSLRFRKKCDQDEASDSSCPGCVGNEPFRNAKQRSDAILVANVEEHALRDDALHLPRLKVHDKERLPANDLGSIGTLLLDASDDRTLMIAEVDLQQHKFIRALDIADGKYCSYTN